MTEAALERECQRGRTEHNGAGNDHPPCHRCERKSLGFDDPVDAEFSDAHALVVAAKHGGELLATLGECGELRGELLVEIAS